MTASVTPKMLYHHGHLGPGGHGDIYFRIHLLIVLHFTSKVVHFQRRETRKMRERARERAIERERERG